MRAFGEKKIIQKISFLKMAATVQATLPAPSDFRLIFKKWCMNSAVLIQISWLQYHILRQLKQP
ncbi:hypothetical protein AM233_10145 [Bacillus sp. FJAT-22058]|nr:hypothetical protein AM233_10145 [Bacillus sp. FJAT-22058]